MNDKTREQIEAMKNQTIGVEIEMNNITREKAARKVAEYFGTRAWNAAGEYGYYSWACKDGQGRVWKFQRDVSIYGPDAEKCELVTPILTYDDIETLQEIIRLLRKAGAKSGPSRGCGVHIHIGKGDHTAKTIRNLVNIMAAHEQQIGRAIRIDAGRTGQYCRVVDHRFLDRLNREKPTTMRKLEDIWYEGNGSSWENRNAHYNSSRYHMLNLHATFTKGTIEFRLFQFADPADGKRNGLHAGEMKAYIQLCLAMSQLAKMVRTASPKPQQTDNEKYAMRCWMLRLGFIGDEFATAREILLRNMEGERAFITGDGVGKPLGLLAETGGAKVGVTAAQKDAVTFDEIFKLYYALKAPYRKKAQFLCNEALVLQLMTIKDNNGNYIWKPGLEIGKPDTLLNRPLKTSAFMPEIKGGSKVMAFGDYSYYWVADRQNRTFRRLNELYARTDQVGFLTTQRVDGKLILPEAVQLLQMAPQG